MVRNSVIFRLPVYGFNSIISILYSCDLIFTDFMRLVDFTHKLPIEYYNDFTFNLETKLIAAHYISTTFPFVLHFCINC